jgi:hypothetical protein
MKTDIDSFMPGALSRMTYGERGLTMGKGRQPYIMTKSKP